MKKVGFGRELKTQVSGIFRVLLYRAELSNGSGTEKVGFRRVREFQKFEMSGSGVSGMKKVGFRRELKIRVSGIFRAILYQTETSNGSGTEKVGFGRVREFPKFEKSGSGLSGIEKTRVWAGIFGFGNSQTHH